MIQSAAVQYDADLKIASANQALILAGDRSAPAGRPGVAADGALSLFADDATLRRVTIVAARADSGLILWQGDYATAIASDSRSARPRHESQPTIDVTVTDLEPAAVGASLVAPPGASNALPAAQFGMPATDALHPDEHGNIAATRGGYASARSPVDLYARTQRTRSPERRSPLLDVLA
jgi:hypothetical protein